MIFDLSTSEVPQGIEADAYAGASDPTVEIDTLGYTELLVVVNAGTVGTSIDVKLQESDTAGSGQADITGAAFTQITGSDAVSVARIRLHNVERYVTIDTTVVGTCDFGVVAVLAGGKISSEADSESSVYDFDLAGSL